MKITMFLLAILCTFTLSSIMSRAKDCDCKQHRAGASGTGSCSLTEDSSYCSITYSASSSGNEGTSSSRYSSSQSRSSQTIQDAKLAVGRYQIQISISETFRMLNTKRPDTFSRGEFRDILINAFSLAGGGQYTQSFVQSLGIGGKLIRKDSEFDSLYDRFKSDGCIEYFGDGFRFLLISTFSKFNGSCR
jgi:hypothetical protein